MVLYSVVWSSEVELTKGKGRVKNKDSFLAITVLCRNAGDAIRALHYHFYHVFCPDNNISLDDGEIKLKRMKIDSRGFNALYLQMDGIREPIYLSDLKSNILRLNKIF